MARRPHRINVEWQTAPDLEANGQALERMTLETLMDIRAELRQLNSFLNCRNFVGIPATLRTISKKLTQKAAK